MRYGVVSVLALMVAACGGAGDGAKDKAAEATASARATDGDLALASTDAPVEAPPAKGRDEKVKTGVYTFGYSYPDAAAAIPGLKTHLDAALDADRGQLASSAREGKAEAEKSGFPYHAYERQTEWKVVTDLPGWISLSAEHWEYSGGAHGMSVFDSLLWDRGADTLRKPIDMFASQDALRAAVKTPFCDALDRERAKKRGVPVQRDNGEMFTDCIDPAAQTIILGSSNRKTFDRIGFLVAPYEAGPFAEGSYEVTLPVTGKVMAALRPQYRSVFTPKP